MAEYKVYKDGKKKDPAKFAKFFACSDIVFKESEFPHTLRPKKQQRIFFNYLIPISTYNCFYHIDTPFIS